MSKYKTKTAQARRAEEVRVADLVSCDQCGMPCAPTGTGTDWQGFNITVGECLVCARVDYAAE